MILCLFVYMYVCLTVYLAVWMADAGLIVCFSVCLGDGDAFDRIRLYGCLSVCFSDRLYVCIYACMYGVLAAV